MLKWLSVSEQPIVTAAAATEAAYNFCNSSQHKA